MSEAARPPDAYGGFGLGGMRLALPMSALREVVPCAALCELPCAALGVIGGLDLRGAIVPVLDLRIVLGRECRPAPFASVIIMVHEGRLLGLLADGVTGVFTVASGDVNPVHSDDPLGAILCGGIRRRDDGTLVSVLSPQALARLPRMPMVQDPEPGRQHANDGEGIAIADTGATSVPMMLVRCERVALAIDAMAVHATLSDPRVEASLLATGDCRGVIRYGGSKVPAIDLLAWCGLGSLAERNWRQAFVVRLDTGMVAFLVEAVVDIVPIQAGQTIPLPAFALPRPALFVGALSPAALPAPSQDPSRHRDAHHLVLASEALRTDPQVLALARVNTADSEPSTQRSPTRTAAAVAPTARSAAATGRTASAVDARPGIDASTDASRAGQSRNVITYFLGHETATPIEQVREILPYRSGQTEFGAHPAARGIAVVRDRSVAIVCLSALTTGVSQPLSDAASVLVVESAGELFGFAVPALTAIEPTDWQAPAEAGDLAEGCADAGSAPAAASVSRRLGLVGSGGRERLLPMLDLLALARSLQAQAA